MWSCQGKPWTNYWFYQEVEPIIAPCLLAWEGDHQFGIQVLPQGIQTSPIQLFWCLRCCIWHTTTFRGRCFVQVLGAPVHPLKHSLPDPAATLWHWMTYRPWTSQKSKSIPHPILRGPEHPDSSFTCQLCARALAAWHTQLQVWVSWRLC